MPINTPWPKAELKRQIREFKQREEAAGAKVPSATTQLMQFCDNYERTCKYTALSFLPSAIALQFRRMANVYFLVVGGLYTVNSISHVQGVTRLGTIGALCVVILASLVREGLQTGVTTYAFLRYIPCLKSLSRCGVSAFGCPETPSAHGA